MINRIPITIDERGSVSKEITILAMENENHSKTLSILLPNSILDKWLYIEFEKADNTKFVSPRIEVKGSYIEYTLGINLLDQVGKLICQVVAKNGEELVWKSNKFDFSISSSINATEQVAESNPDILADLQSQIDLLEAGEGADLTNYYTKVDIDTKLNEKQDALTAGANITIIDNVISASGGGSGVSDYNDLTNKPIEYVSNPVISELPTGIYKITGDYKWFSTDFIGNLFTGTLYAFVNNYGLAMQVTLIGDKVKVYHVNPTNKVVMEIPLVESSGGGGASFDSTIETTNDNYIILEPYKYKVINLTGNSLTLNFSDVSEGYKVYQFEIGLDRVAPIFTITNEEIELPAGFILEKYNRYLCEVVNNKLSIKGVYNNYPYKWVFGLWSSPDYTTSYKFNEDLTCVQTISGTTTNGTYEVNESDTATTISVTLSDDTFLLFTYNQDGTITNNSVVYTKLA